MTDKVLAAVTEATDGGRLPVVVNESSCTQGLVTMVAKAARTELTVVDAVDFAATRMLDQPDGHAPVASVALHPTCSSTELGTTAALEAVARLPLSRRARPAGLGLLRLRRATAGCCTPS